MSRDTERGKLFAQLERTLKTQQRLEHDLRQLGDNDVADVVKRARREFMHPNYTSAVNTLGMDPHELR
jgi:hypothetical protein